MLLYESIQVGMVGVIVGMVAGFYFAWLGIRSVFRVASDTILCTSRSIGHGPSVLSRSAWWRHAWLGVAGQASRQSHSNRGARRRVRPCAGSREPAASFGARPVFAAIHRTTPDEIGATPV
ncbi:hypothetical protein JCM18920_2398 [Cutibacterium acnes JCM 18920]|nr:hypothetical protein JCM18920_2398 [Cutibacterium acnes JCM 18920]